MFNSDHMGPHVLPLTPVGHDAFGRAGFYIHGDDGTKNTSTSCLIMPPSVRLQIAGSRDTILYVVL